MRKISILIKEAALINIVINWKKKELLRGRKQLLARSISFLLEYIYITIRCVNGNE